MANPTGFLQYPRVEVGHRPIEQRIQDWHEIDQPLVDRVFNQQAARCMDCGMPFCHAVGCPLKNRIPEFNESGLPQPVARRRPRTCTRRTISPRSPAGCVPRRARPLARWP